jgi:hypothetical protein
MRAIVQTWTNWRQSVSNFLTLPKARIPQSVHTSIMALQFIDNIEIVYPLPIAVDTSNVRVLLASLADLSLQQPIEDRILHREVLHVDS